MGVAVNVLLKVARSVGRSVLWWVVGVNASNFARRWCASRDQHDTNSSTKDLSSGCDDAHASHGPLTLEMGYDERLILTRRIEFESIWIFIWTNMFDVLHLLVDPSVSVVCVHVMQCKLSSGVTRRRRLLFVLRPPWSYCSEFNKKFLYYW